MDFTLRTRAFIDVKTIYRLYEEKRRRRLLKKAAERHARASSFPGGEFTDKGGRLDKLRFLRREHMYLDWSSWHSAVRDD